MVKDDPALPGTEQEQLDQAKYLAWRIEVADRLNTALRWTESINFRACGEFHGGCNVLVCENDPTHEVRALAFTCHLRYCPDCERRHQAKLVAKYTPILKDISEQDDRAGWSLKMIELTTPYALAADNAEQLYADGWEAFERWQQLMLQFLLQREMTSDEIRRGRIDYKQHGYGAMVSAEFGEKGRKLHFHILAYMPWLDKHKSSDLWLEASGGEAEITWISALKYHGVEDAVRETVKYVTKFQELPPALVVKLADVLDGARRVRTYGTVRGAVAPIQEAHVCMECASKLSIMRVREYFIACIERNTLPAPAIYSAAEHLYLDLKRGNKVGEAGEHLARDAPTEVLKQANLPFLDAIATRKKPFQYH